MEKDIFGYWKDANSDEERDWLVMQYSLDSLRPELQEAIWAASILRWFDEEYLKAIPTEA